MYVIRTYKSANGVVEKTKFIVGSNTRRWTGKRTGKKCSVKKQTENDKAAVRTLARILNCNFAPKDLLLTFTASDDWVRSQEQGETEQEKMDAVRKAMDHEITLWLRRVFRKSGLKLRYVVVVSDMDGETGELCRIHAHVPIKAGLSWDLIQSEWKHGEVSIREFREQDDYTPIAAYLLRQVRRQPEANKYRCSKGMEKPVVEEIFVASGSALRVPTQAKVLEDNVNAENENQYIRYKTKPAGKKQQEKEELRQAQEPISGRRRRTE